MSKSTVRQYLWALEEKGAIRREHYGHRSIEIVEHEGDRGLPIVGRAAASAPILAVENIQDRIDVGELFGKGKSRGADFLLRVKGDSMTGAGIFGGDLVAVRAQPEVALGEIGVVIVNDEATVKRVYARGQKLRLVSENPRFKALDLNLATEEVRVVGKVAGVIRRV